MRLHGWAVCLGTVLAGSAAAQPPATAERFPPAPSVSNTGRVVPAAGARPVVTSNQYALPKTSAPIDGRAVPLSKAAPVPYSPVVTTTTSTPAPIPAGVVIPPGQTITAPGPACDSGSPNCAVPGCSDHTGKILDWLKFRSGVTKWGCSVTPYQPSLQAWFPCDPKKSGNCTTCATLPGTIVGSTQVLPPGAPESVKPVPAPTTPGAPVAPPMTIPTVPGGPKAPQQMPPVSPKVGGLSFAPGGAPMAAPTTQAERQTKFKPK